MPGLDSDALLRWRRGNSTLSDASPALCNTPVSDSGSARTSRGKLVSLRPCPQSPSDYYSTSNDQGLGKRTAYSDES